MPLNFVENTRGFTGYGIMTRSAMCYLTPGLKVNENYPDGRGHLRILRYAENEVEAKSPTIPRFV